MVTQTSIAYEVMTKVIELIRMRR